MAVRFDAVLNKLLTKYVNVTGDTMTGDLTLETNLILPATTATTGIIYSGTDLLLHTYTTGSTFLGPRAGNLTTTGSYNVGIGEDSMPFITSGVGNTGIGAGALYALAGGTGNFALGRGTLGANQAGNYNIGIGYYALAATTTSYNLGIGRNALRYDTSGAYNIGIGYYALHRNVLGHYNTVVGSNAGYGAANQSNSYNVFIGASAGYAVTTGSNNAIIGYNAGLALTSGANNILLGYQAGDNLTTGGSNIIIGYDIDASAVDVSNELNIGGLIKGDTSATTLGFFGVAAVARQTFTAISDPPTQAEVTAIRDALVNLGLMAAS